MGKKSSKLAEQLKARKSALKKPDIKPADKTAEAKPHDRSSSTTSTAASSTEKQREMKRAREKSTPVFVYRTPTKTTSAVKSPPVPESYKDKDAKKETKENTDKKSKDVAKATEEKKDKEKKVDKKRSKEKGDDKDRKQEKQEKKEQPDAFDTMLEGIVGMDSDSEKSHCSSTTLELGKTEEEEVGGDDGCDDEESESEENAEDEQESSSEMEEDGSTESSAEEAEPEAPKKKWRRKWKDQMRMKGKVQKGKQFLMLQSVLKKVQPGPIRCLIKRSGMPFLDNAMTEKNSQLLLPSMQTLGRRTCSSCGLRTTKTFMSLNLSCFKTLLESMYYQTIPWKKGFFVVEKCNGVVRSNTE